MGNGNNFMGNGSNLPANMPPPADAWLDMRARLDEDMPVGTPPLTTGIISVDNTLFRSVTLLFLLLLLSCPALLFRGKNADGRGTGKYSAVTIAEHKATPVIDENNNAQQPAGIDAAHAAGAMVNTNNNAIRSTTKTGKKHNKTRFTQNLPAAKQTFPVTTANSISNSATRATQPGNQPALNAVTQPPVNKQPTQQHDKQTAVTGSDDDKKDENNDDKASWQAGLLWKVQVPFSGTKHYFDGPNGKSQPYRLLIPGVWAAMQYGHDMLDAELNVFTSTMYRPQQFYSYLTIPNPNQPITVDEEYKLAKTFGISLALGYSHNIHANWWGGVNLQLTKLTGATNTIDSTITAPNSTTYRSGFRKVNDNLWRDFNKFQVRLGAQLLYKANHWQAGIKTGLYFTSPVSKFNTVHNPLETELFFRWGLRQWKK